MVQKIEIADNGVAQRSVSRIFVHRLALARAFNIYIEYLPDRCRRRRSQDGDAVRKQQGLIDIIGHQNDRALLVLTNAFDLILQFGPGQRIKRRQWLVHQQDFRLHRERPGDSNALPHAAGKLRGLAVHGMIQADQLDLLPDQGQALFLRFFLVNRVNRQRDIGLNAQPWKQ